MAQGLGRTVALLVFSLISTGYDASAHLEVETSSRFIQVAAATREERTQLANLGMSIEFVRSDSVWGFASPSVLEDLERAGAKVLGNHDFEIGRGGHHGVENDTEDFPSADARFHNYAEMTEALGAMAAANRDIATVVSIGKTIEGRDIWALHINTTPASIRHHRSNKPGIVYMGAHHAREHLSVEIPLMFGAYLLQYRNHQAVARLLATRDIWIIPMVNPDGAEYDIATGKYRMWRKNRRQNDNGTFGVDLNRNYGYGWGTGGSSSNPSSDVYMGKAPFSEPETQAIKNFIEQLPNIRVLLSFHTFSELILYPWGGKYDPVPDAKDRATFEAMASTMAGWNKYKPQQASDLYIASGDTVDWAYATRRIFGFTFELSPKSSWQGGFYPGAKVIDKVFADNLRPALYLLDLADDPYRALGTRPTGFLKNYVQPQDYGSPLWSN